MRSFKKMSVGALLGAVALVSVALVQANEGGLKSGVDKGKMLSAFEPTHVTGADKGTKTCPVCKYPTFPAVQVWINNDDRKNVEAIVTTLEKATKANTNKKMKAFVIFLAPEGRPAAATAQDLKALGEKLKVQNVALAYVSSKDDAVSDYKINTDSKVKNTVFVYRDRKVDTKFVNLTADAKGLESLNAAVKNIVAN